MKQNKVQKILNKNIYICKKCKLKRLTTRIKMTFYMQFEARKRLNTASISRLSVPGLSKETKLLNFYHWKHISHILSITTFLFCLNCISQSLVTMRMKHSGY